MSKVRYYIIPDLRTWANPEEFNTQTKIEYFTDLAVAVNRFNELYKLPYNYEHALNTEGLPAARLAFGISEDHIAFDLIHVRNGKKVLVTDFLRANYYNNYLHSIIRNFNTLVGIDQVCIYTEGVRLPKFITFSEWNTNH